MNNYIFLTENHNEGSTIYAIPADKIERMALSDTYSKYGQRVDAEAGDSFTINTEAAAAKINNYLHDEKFSKGEYISAYEHPSIHEDVLKNVKFDQGEIEHYKEMCDGFNYWDGHNWKTVTTRMEHGEPSHKILAAEELIKKLNDAIDNKEFVKDGFGKKIYQADGWEIINNCCQGVWAYWEITAADTEK